MRRILPAAALVLAFAAGCDSTPTPASSENAVQPSFIGTIPSPTRSQAPLDAKAVLDRLRAANLGLTEPAVQDEDTDPNDLLGRPNGYTSRASASLPGGSKDSDKYTIDRGRDRGVAGKGGGGSAVEVHSGCAEERPDLGYGVALPG
jgi:hypothetical protein